MDPISERIQLSGAAVQARWGAFYLKSFRNSARATVRLAFDDADPTIANNLLVGLMLNETRRG